MIPIWLPGAMALWVLSIPISGEIIVNEVMANEPQRFATLQWIELYNNSTGDRWLGGYRLEIVDTLASIRDSISLPNDLILKSGEFFIVCRSLFSTENSPGFEAWWGDDSGEWGDSPEEDSLQTPFSVYFNLINAGGSVVLRDADDSLMSEFHWSEEGRDGYSWEREEPDGSHFGQSIDPSGSTPGFANSLTPMARDRAVDSTAVRFDQGTTVIEVSITNRGTNRMPEDYVTLYQLQGDTLPEAGDTIDIISIPSLDPTESLRLTRRYVLEGLYLPLRASLSRDDRDRNNHISFTAMGTRFPPVIITELMPNPTGRLLTEWVELKNRLDEPFDIAGWHLGDSISLRPIVADTTFRVAPGEHFVLTRDVLQFRDYYAGFPYPIIQPNQWPVFNNDRDRVRLVDKHGFDADSFSYSFTFGDNHSWARGEDAHHAGRWGRSEEVGGSPGGSNRVVYEPDGDGVRLAIRPRVFSPDGDGFEDSTIFAIEAPLGETTLRVYDHQGREVATLLDNERYPPSEVVWHGRSSGGLWGRRLPIGIYIVYLEASGGESVKETVVIAR